MINEWTCHPHAHGLDLVPTDAPDDAAIHVREHVAMIDIDAAIAEERARLALGDVDVKTERVVTAEGEYARLATFTATDGATSIACTIALVYGEDWCRRIDARATAAIAPATFEAVRELVHALPLGLGELRRRPFLYAPPPGWEMATQVGVATWTDPAHAGATIQIPYAWPGSSVEPPLVERVRLAGEARLFLEEARESSPIAAASGLTGQRIVAIGQTPGHPRRAIVRVFLRDDRFTYHLRMGCAVDQQEALHAIFDAVVRSVEPLPQSTASAAIRW